ELHDKATTSSRNAVAAISKSYTSVVVPLRTRSGEAPYALTTLDLRTMVTANRSLHERVVTALEPHVFTTLTAARLVALAGLGPDRRIVSCSDLVDWFYSYFEFTKVWDKKAIASAISRAVAESAAGYSVGLGRHGDSLTLRDSSHVHIGTTIPVDEIDLSDDAALIWADHAAEILASKAKPQPGGTDPGAGQPGGETGPEPPAGGTPGTAGGRRGPAP